MSLTIITITSYIHSHPHALAFLELLQHNEFRDALGQQHVIDMLHNNQFYHWKFGRLNRALEAEAASTVHAVEADDASTVHAVASDT